MIDNMDTRWYNFYNTVFRKGMIRLKISKRKLIAYIKLILEVAAVIVIVVFMFKFAMGMMFQTAEDVQQQTVSAETEE